MTDRLDYTVPWDEERIWFHPCRWHGSNYALMRQKVAKDKSDRDTKNEVNWRNNSGRNTQ